MLLDCVASTAWQSLGVQLLYVLAVWVEGYRQVLQSQKYVMGFLSVVITLVPCSLLLIVILVDGEVYLG